MGDIFKNTEDLINALKVGNNDAYAFLIKKYYKKLYVYALSLTNNKALAKDILQNVFLNVWNYRKKLNSDYSLKNFLYTSTYNEFSKQYWKNQSAKDLEDKYAYALNEVVGETDEEAIKKLMIIITQGINKLPKKCKEVFLLSKQDGLTNIEISEHLRISIKTVEAHITNAYSIIRKSINENTTL